MSSTKEVVKFAEGIAFTMKVGSRSQVLIESFFRELSKVQCRFYYLSIPRHRVCLLRFFDERRHEVLPILIKSKKKAVFVLSFVQIPGKTYVGLHVNRAGSVVFKRLDPLSEETLFQIALQAYRPTLFTADVDGIELRRESGRFDDAVRSNDGVEGCCSDASDATDDLYDMPHDDDTSSESDTASDPDYEPEAGEGFDVIREPVVVLPVIPHDPSCRQLTSIEAMGYSVHEVFHSYLTLQHLYVTQPKVRLELSYSKPLQVTGARSFYTFDQKFCDDNNIGKRVETACAEERKRGETGMRTTDRRADEASRFERLARADALDAANGKSFACRSRPEAPADGDVGHPWGSESRGRAQPLSVSAQRTPQAQPSPVVFRSLEQILSDAEARSRSPARCVTTEAQRGAAAAPARDSE